DAESETRALRDRYRLDEFAVLEPEQKLFRSVARSLSGGDDEPGQREMFIEQIPESSRNVGHLRKRPHRALPEMPGHLRAAERLLAVLEREGAQQLLGVRGEHVEQVLFHGHARGSYRAGRSAK